MFWPQQLLLSLSGSRQNPYNSLFILESYLASEAPCPRFVYRSKGGSKLA